MLELIDMSSPPKVFISYSHDSLEHKQWIAKVAVQLRESGIDAILDQWDLTLGDDVTRFMEQGVTGADRVLVVCTNEYVRKAEAGEGGVGYERLIVTAELVANLGTNKFIPILRNVTGDRKVPVFLATRLYIDFSDDTEFDSRFEELLRELHKAPALEKPPIGKNPFAATRSRDQMAEVTQGELLDLPMRPEDPIEIYNLAVELVRRSDLYGWRQLAKRVRKPIRRTLLDLRMKHEKEQPKDLEQLNAIVNEAVNGIASLLVLAIVGVESGRETLRDQRSVIDDLLEIEGWARSGLTVLVDLPYALAYVYQGLHGAMCLWTGQLDLALSMAEMQVRNNYNSRYERMWEAPGILHPETLGNTEEAWKFLSSAAERWNWLEEVFGTEKDYRVALSAYFAALSLNELATDIVEGRAANFTKDSMVMLELPPVFALEQIGIQRQAVQLLMRSGGLEAIFKRKGVEMTVANKLILESFSATIKKAIPNRRFIHQLPLDDLLNAPIT